MSTTPPTDRELLKAQLTFARHWAQWCQERGYTLNAANYEVQARNLERLLEEGEKGVA
jgi:hypothetical protein